MKTLAKAFLLVILALSATGCATYTFQCAKSVSWALNPSSNPAQLIGMCDGKKTVVLEGPGPGDVQHLCDKGKIHWFKDSDKLTCVDDPCVVAGKVSIFNPDRSIVCGNQ